MIELQGFSDASPSEVISLKKEVLSVATLFRFSDSTEAIPPVGQYKSVSQARKALEAGRLREWMLRERHEGLNLVGMVNVLRQADAARYGIDMLEELPDVRVSQVAEGSFRLHFGHRHVNMTVAIALIYYWTTVRFGALRMASHLPKGSRLIVNMDRFPGPSPATKIPGIELSKTAGQWFIDYLEMNSKTGQDLQAESASGGFSVQFTTLSWWRPTGGLSLFNEGKTHPHFTFPDWLTQAAIATSFPDTYLQGFNHRNHGVKALDEMTALRSEFARHDIWSMDEVFEYLRPAERRWSVPDEVRERFSRDNW